MDQITETVIYTSITVLLSVLLLKIGEKIGEYLAKRREKETYDFKSEFKKILDEWRSKVEEDDN